MLALRQAVAAGAIALVTLLGGAAPALACNAMKHRKAIDPPGGGRAALVVGDSVLLGAADRVAEAGFEVDARGCRQWSAGLQILRARAHTHSLPPLVIVGLGTNGSARRAVLDQALSIVGQDRVLGLMTPREVGGRGGTDAALVRRYVKEHPGRTVLLDWVAFSAGHGGWFSGDGIHLGAAGAAGMVRLLRAARRKAPAAICA